MDKQVMAVILSFALYILYVLLPMIPSVVIYRMFPDTKVSASGILSNLNFKTSGAFAAYVITVFLGFFLVENTHNLIAQVSNPVWTLKTKVKLLNQEGSLYPNTNLLETLVVTIDPKLQRINGDEVILSLPGCKKNWETTQLRFDIPRFGYKVATLGELSQNATIDNYELLVKVNQPITITPDPQMISEYSANYTNTLTPNNNFGPEITVVGGN